MNPRIETTTNRAIVALEEKIFFKLVCGASLTDIKMIENLSFVFTLAGAHVIDLAPSADVIFAARKGVQKALSRDMLQHVSTPLLMASIQIDTDPHFRKIEVDYNLCDLCGACIKACPTEAFKIEGKKFIYLIERCFGCGACPSYCHVSALNLVNTKPAPKQTLKEMILLGVKSIEFHFGENFKRLEIIWDEIKDLLVEASGQMPLLSFSIGSGLLADEEIKKAANLCYRLAGKDIILQCDGIPMSGALDKEHKGTFGGNNSDNKSLHVAKIIQEEKLPVYLQISGGTNQYSYAKAVESGINVNGVAVGSYARKLLMPYLVNLDDERNLHKAVQLAKSLVCSVGTR